MFFALLFIIFHARIRVRSRVGINIPHIPNIPNVIDFARYFCGDVGGDVSLASLNIPTRSGS